MDSKFQELLTHYHARMAEEDRVMKSDPAGVSRRRDEFLLAVGPEEVGDQVRYRAVGIVGVVGRVNPVEKGAERHRELTCVRLGRDVRHTGQANNALPQARMVLRGGCGETTRAFRIIGIVGLTFFSGWAAGGDGGR